MICCCAIHMLAQSADPVEKYSEQGQRALAQGDYAGAEAAFARRIEITLELAGEHVLVAATAIGAEADRRIAVGRATEAEASRLRVATGKRIAEGGRSREGQRRSNAIPNP